MVKRQSPKQVSENCRICNKLCVSSRGLGSHVNHTHGITIKEYNDLYKDEISSDKITKALNSFTGVYCPICYKSNLHSISQHLANTHRNVSLEEFKNLYPTLKLVSDYNSIIRKEMQSRANYKTPEYRKKQSDATKIQHQTTDLQDKIAKGIRHGWTKYTNNSGDICVLKSKGERIFASFLDKNNILWKSEIKIPYYDSEKLKNRTYLADFYLPNYNLIIEVKPDHLMSSINAQDKRLASINLGYNYSFLSANCSYQTSNNLMEALNVL